MPIAFCPATTPGVRDDQFVRVHRSTIVNQRRIREIGRDGRDLVVVLAGGTQLQVAPSHRERLEGVLGG